MWHRFSPNPKNVAWFIWPPEENFWPSLKCLAIMSGFSGTEISVRAETTKKAENGRTVGSWQKLFTYINFQEKNNLIFH